MEKKDIDRLNKRRKIEDSVAYFFQENNFSADEIIECCKALTKKFTIDWTAIQFADWFSSLLLQYVNIKDISSLDVAICNRSGRPQWFESLTRYTPSVSLQFFDSVIWSDNLVSWIILRNLHFGELAIVKGYSEISNDGMYGLAQQCRELKTLKICNSTHLLDDKRLQYLVAICYKLKRIKLLYDFPLSLDSCIWLGGCEQLEHIVISADKGSLPAANIKALFKNKQKLHYLEIGCKCDAAILLELGTNCPLLEHLDIYQAENLLTVHFEMFTQGCTKLKTLAVNNIYGNANWTAERINKLIEVVGKNCPLLESLTMMAEWPSSVVTEASFKSLAQGCPLLKILHIDATMELSAQGLKYLTEYSSMLTDVAVSNSYISEEELVEISKIKNLKNLCFSFCDDVTDACIEAMVKENGHKLETLDIFYRKQLTDDSLSSISNYCPNLRSISLGENHQDMTSVSLLRMAQKCQKLISFSCIFRGNTVDTSLVDRVINERILLRSK